MEMIFLSIRIIKDVQQISYYLDYMTREFYKIINVFALHLAKESIK